MLTTPSLHLPRWKIYMISAHFRRLPHTSLGFTVPIPSFREETLSRTQASFINLHGCGVSVCCGPDDVIVAMVCSLRCAVATVNLVGAGGGGGEIPSHCTCALAILVF